MERKTAWPSGGAHILNSRVGNAFISTKLLLVVLSRWRSLFSALSWVTSL